MVKEYKIAILGVECDATNILINLLGREYNIASIIFEQPVSKVTLLKRRAKKIGWFNAIGQVLFVLTIDKALRKISAYRIKQILKENKLDNTTINKSKVKAVASANDDDCLNYLQTIQPHLVILSGTRIVSKKILQGVNAPFINIHAGITTKYRGVHGGYWALVNGDRDLCGVTLHYVDAGIDTGTVIEQCLITPMQEDNFATYPYLQLCEGLKLLLKNLPQLKTGFTITNKPLTTTSSLWYHPSIWQYIYYRLARKIK
jgi:folate-dependent phosphoribosylglycinamide formyltransferase PurN